MRAKGTPTWVFLAIADIKQSIAEKRACVRASGIERQYRNRLAVQPRNADFDNWFVLYR